MNLRKTRAWPQPWADLRIPFGERAASLLQSLLSYETLKFTRNAKCVSHGVCFWVKLIGHGGKEERCQPLNLNSLSAWMSNPFKKRSLKGPPSFPFWLTFGLPGADLAVL